MAEPSVQIDWLELLTRRFLMGSDDNLDEIDDDEGPARDVTVGRLLTSRTPVTVAQFAEFVEATGFETVAEEEGSAFVGTFPAHELVLGATWRRPFGPDSVEAEPEAYVSQVAWTDARAFCEWSDARLPTEAEWERMGCDDAVELEPRPGEWWQWTADYYDPTFHRSEQRVNPQGPHHGTHRVARGGSERLTKREAFFPDLSAADLTFRVVHTRLT